MTTLLLDACKSFLKCQLLHYEEKIGKRDSKLPKPFVTLSRETGAGGITVGKLLVEYLNEKDSEAICPWTIFDKDMVDYVIKEHHLPKEAAKYMTEAKTSEVKDILETLLELHPPSFVLVKDTSETILHLAQWGHAVLVGRGGNLVTRELKGGVRVRLVAPLDKKIAHVCEYYGLSEKVARKKIDDEDRSRKAYLKQNFGKNIEDASLYDLVINTGRVSFETAAVLIGEAVLGQRKSLQESERSTPRALK